MPSAREDVYRWSIIAGSSLALARSSPSVDRSTQPPLLGGEGGRHTGAVNPVPNSPAPRAPLPPIARELVWTEWLLVAAVWLVIALLPVGMLTENARRAGISVAF